MGGERGKIKVWEMGWPNELRLIINRNCNYKCNFPGVCVSWCHEDGAHYSKGRVEEALTEDFVYLARVLKGPFRLKKVKIGGMEPLLFPQVGNLIRRLKEAGFEEVSLTTNGYYLIQRAAELKEAGLDILTVSMHAFNRLQYKRITRVDGFERVLKGIKTAVDLKFETIKVNRVLLKFENYWQDLMNFFDFAVANQLTVKLYQLIWSTKMAEEIYSQNYFSGRALFPYLINRGRLKMIKRFLLPARDRLFWELDSGLKVETDVFWYKIGAGLFGVCRRCPLAVVCQEGLLSYGLEVNSLLEMGVCLLREELAVNIWDEVKERKGDKLVSKVSAFINSLEVGPRLKII